MTAVRGAILALVLICLALGAVSALEIRHMSVAHGFPLAWRTIFASTMPRWLVLAAALPFALALATRPWLGPPERREGPGRVGHAEVPHTPRSLATLGMTGRTAVLLHVTVFLAISWAHAAVIAWTLAFANPNALFFPWPARLLRAWYGSMPIMVAMYGAVLAAAWALNEARERERRSLRASQLEAQLQAARLAVLRARLQPHFLYNTLNGIAALVADTKPEEAVAAIEQLSELLHASLRDDGRDAVSVQEEVALAERYLALQRMRFGDRLEHSVTVAAEVARDPVPVLLLQPLVENAVLHGMESGQRRLQVRIAAAAVAHRLELRVENDGPELASSPRDEGRGVGLAATRARLATAYGAAASLELLPREGGGVIVRLVLPRSGPAAEVEEPA